MSTDPIDWQEIDWQPTPALWPPPDGIAYLGITDGVATFQLTPTHRVELRVHNGFLPMQEPCGGPFIMENGVQTDRLLAGMEAACLLVNQYRSWVVQQRVKQAISPEAGDRKCHADTLASPALPSSLVSLRAQLGAAAVITPTRACELLPMRESTAMAWLRDHKLILKVGDVDVVLWGDVLDTIRDHGLARPAAAPRGATLRRAAL